MLDVAAKMLGMTAKHTNLLNLKPLLTKEQPQLTMDAKISDGC